MVLYECYNCGYTNINKLKMRHHLDRKKICKKMRENINLNELNETILQGISYQEYLNLNLEKTIDTEMYPNVSNNVSNCIQNVSKKCKIIHKEYKCKYCNKNYKYSQSLSKHKNKCKLKLEQQLEEDMINKLQLQLAQKDKQLKTKDKHLAQKDKKLTNIIKQSNKTINHGIINNNNNIVINSYTTPDLSHLTSKDIYSCLSKNVFCAAELIEKIYFNENKPENHNICLTNLKTPYISVFDGTNWNIKKKVIAFDDLLDQCENTFTDFIEEWDGKYPDTVLKFNKFLDRIYDDTDLLRKNIYEDLTYKMYNNSKKLNIKI
jgi:hypothetical protein